MLEYFKVSSFHLMKPLLSVFAPNIIFNTAIDVFIRLNISRGVEENERISTIELRSLVTAVC